MFANRNAYIDLWDCLVHVVSLRGISGNMLYRLQNIVCAFIPLLKSALKDAASSDSYRAIANSSLILQIFERTIILLWGDSLQTDSLQFGFKKGCGTSTASWLVNEVLNHYIREGSKPVAIILDCPKAFDLARFDVLSKDC